MIVCNRCKAETDATSVRVTVRDLRATMPVQDDVELDSLCVDCRKRLIEDIQAYAEPLPDKPGKSDKPSPAAVSHPVK
jgi:hypothetical protein